MFYKKPFIRNTSLISEENKKRGLVLPGKIRNAISIYFVKIDENSPLENFINLLPNFFFDALRAVVEGS